jgi:predicted cupin superfamily sugar epimerase
MTAAEIIARLGLKPLPVEGGYFAETYRSARTFDGRSGGTAIYYLLTPDTFSALHRLRSDEVFHFYLGDPVRQLQLRPDGTGREFVLGGDLSAGQVPQLVVPAGVWQGSVLEPGGRFALMGTTMAPGFDFADFQAGDRAELTAAYPAFAEMIGRLTAG